MQCATQQGLTYAPDAISRCSILCIHNLSQAMGEALLKKTWRGKTLEEVRNAFVEPSWTPRDVSEGHGPAYSSWG